MDSTGTTLGDTTVWRSWPYMTALEKRLLTLSVVFGIVIFALMLALIARDYRDDDGTSPISPPYKGKACSLNISNMLTNSPLLLLEERNDFVYPNANGSTINLENNSSIKLACPSSQITGLDGNFSQTALTCLDSQYEVSRKIVLPTRLTCSSKISSTARYTGNGCEGQGKEIEVGYAINMNNFVRQIRICFNETDKNTLYSQFVLTSAIGNRARSNPRPFFNQSFFYGQLNLNDIYRNQSSIINNLLGLAMNDSTYIKNNTDFFLAKGHLAAMADFVYAVQQNSTFYYVNTAPQWQTFNGGNWNRLEMDVRNFAQKRQIDLIVYTGTYGVLSLNSTTKNRTIEIFLNETSLPVPKFFWKVVYNEESKKGVAMVGVNNPFINSTTPDLLLCANVTSQVSWLTWNQSNFTQGLSYACEVNDLRKNVTYIPNLDITGLLI